MKIFPGIKSHDVFQPWPQDDTDTTVTCFRDLMIFLSRNKCGTLPENSAMVDGLITEEEMKMPAVFPRYSNLEFINADIAVCFNDKVT